MRNYQGSFVGFFDVAAQILEDLGNNWLEYANEMKNDKARGWSKVFLETSKSVKQVSENLHNIYLEYEKWDTEQHSNPVSLIESFKAKVAGMKKNAKQHTNL